MLGLLNDEDMMNEENRTYSFQLKFVAGFQEFSLCLVFLPSHQQWYILPVPV